MAENRRSMIIEAVLPLKDRKTSSRACEESKPAAKKQKLDEEPIMSTGAIRKTTTVWKPPKVSHTGIPHVARRTATLPVSPLIRKAKKHSIITKVPSADKKLSKVVAATITREGQVEPQLPIKVPTQHKQYSLRNQSFDAIDLVEKPVPKQRTKVTAQSPKKEKRLDATSSTPEKSARKYLMEVPRSPKGESVNSIYSSKNAHESSMEVVRTSPKMKRDLNINLFHSPVNNPPWMRYLTEISPLQPVRSYTVSSEAKAVVNSMDFLPKPNAALPFRSVPLQASLATASNDDVYSTPTGVARREIEGSSPTQQDQPEDTPVAAQRLIQCECAPNKLYHEDLETILDANAVPEEVLRRLRRLAHGTFGQLQRELQSYGFDCFVGKHECPVVALALMRTLLEEEELAFQGLVQASAINLPMTPLHLPPTDVVDHDSPTMDSEELEGAVALPPKAAMSPGPQPFGYCLICWEKAREVAFVPCGHVACCEECSESEMLHFCPTCRGEILDTVRVFLP